MAITEKSSLDKLIEQVGGDDPVQKKLASARAQVQEAQEKLGLHKPRQANGDRPARER